MTDVSNLKNLKQIADSAREAFENELKRINDLLPAGVVLECSGLQSSSVEHFEDIKSNDDVNVGDTLVCIQEASYITEGHRYQVVRKDSSGDPQIIDDDGDEWDTCGRAPVLFQKVIKSQSSNSRHQWINLTFGDRGGIRVGDVVRVNPNADTSGTRVSALPTNRTFEVVRIDGCNDAHLDYQDFDMCNRYHNFQKRV